LVDILESTEARGHLTEFALAIGAARSLAECAALFRQLVTPCGIDAFASGEVDIEVRQRTVFFVIDWPDSWRNFYLRSGLIDRDPLLDALQSHHQPFSWSQLRAERTLSKVGSASLRLAGEHGWTDGLVVPIPRGGSRFGLVSLVGTARDLGESDKATLILACHAFHSRVRFLAAAEGFALPPAGLSARELQCLALVARGHSDRGISEALGIAMSTARDYIDTTKQKLVASTRAEAVALAISLGIIAA
jgi:LuxR family quorum-sensing system transcriptional regulator CciR